jgi:hypothetical protein
MLPRLAAALLSFGFLTAPVVAEARFAEAPPPATEVAPAPARWVEPPTKAEVISALKARRAKNLKAFRAYRKGGVYPHNFVRTGPLNVWRDRDGHLCAAATMIDKDGKHDLVMQTAMSNNFIRLLDVTEGDLMNWILTSGLTIEEIDRIQAPMVMPEPEIRMNYAAEDAKLAAGYAKTDSWLVKREKASLEIAAKRVLENPELARKLVEGGV